MSGTNSRNSNFKFEIINTRVTGHRVLVPPHKSLEAIQFNVVNLFDYSTENSGSFRFHSTVLHFSFKSL